MFTEIMAGEPTHIRGIFKGQQSAHHGRMSTDRFKPCAGIGDYGFGRDTKRGQAFLLGYDPKSIPRSSTGREG